jgi:competence protein CoiA
MALYAVDDDDLIHASDAISGKVYWCLDCFGPVKRRLGKQVYYFYHLTAAPQCRLYSKTEDHLLAQLQLKRKLPALHLEKPFLPINRVADACWEERKIVFEIQCSPITPAEAAQRMKDYTSQGYQVVWLLDDRRYNKKLLRPAEEFLRQHPTYYVNIKRELYYDQFELFHEKQRWIKGRPLPLQLDQVQHRPTLSFTPDRYPQQICLLQSPLYFRGDRLHCALYQPKRMENWLELEKKIPKPKNWFQRLLERIKIEIGMN